MHRLLTYPAIALVLLSLALTEAGYAAPSPVAWATRSAAPLQVRVISVERHRSALFDTRHGTFAAYVIKVSVKNVSGKTMQGYSLRGGVGALAGSTFPYPERQTLRHGESGEEVMLMPLPADYRPFGLEVSVEFVNFSDGTTWGPNQTYARNFVRGKRPRGKRPRVSH